MTLLPTLTPWLIGAAAVGMVLVFIAIGKFVLWWVTRD